MIKRTTYEYDIKHSGGEMDRLEILSCLGKMAEMIEAAHLAEVNVQSVKTDLISVEITTVDIP